MAPIYDSDLAAERWSRDEWRSYELWEQVELRLRNRKRFWVAGAVVLFLLISSIPVVMEQGPRWRSLSATRKLAQELGAIKNEASITGQAFRVRAEADGFGMRVEKAARCDAAEWSMIRRFAFSPNQSLRLISMAEAPALNIPGVVDEFCYDPFLGNRWAAPPYEGTKAAAFAIAPVKDLTESRTDRLGLLLLSGASAEISFE